MTLYNLSLDLTVKSRGKFRSFSIFFFFFRKQNITKNNVSRFKRLCLVPTFADFDKPEVFARSDCAYIVSEFAFGANWRDKIVALIERSEKIVAVTVTVYRISRAVRLDFQIER